MIESFIFYKSFFKMAELITNPMERFALYDAIIQYAINGTEPQFDESFLLARISWEGIKPQIDANTKRKYDGKKGGRPKEEIEKTSGYENKKPVVSEEKNQWFPKEKTSGFENKKPNNNVNDNENENEKNIKKEKLLNESADRIWQAYPKKDGKMKGIEAIINALKRGESEEYLIERVKLYSQSRSVQQGFIMNAQGWFNQKRYTDESLDKPIPQGDVNCISLEEFKRKFNAIYDYNGTDIDEDSTDYIDKMILFVRKLQSVDDFKTKYPNEYSNIINRKDK